MRNTILGKILSLGLAASLILQLTPSLAFSAPQTTRIKPAKSKERKDKHGTIEVKNDTGKDCNDFHIFWRPQAPTIEGIKVKETGKDPFPSGYKPHKAQAGIPDYSDFGRGDKDGSVKAGNSVTVEVAWSEEMPEVAWIAWTLDGNVLTAEEGAAAQTLEIKGKDADAVRAAKAKEEAKAKKEAEKAAAEEEAKAKKEAEKQAKEDAKKAIEDAKKDKGIQKSVNPSGLKEIELPTVNGTVRVLLPDDFAAGDTISGTVIAEPKGATPEERQKNSDELEGMVVDIDGKKVAVKDRKFQWLVPAAGTALIAMFRPDGMPMRANKHEIQIPKPGPSPDPVGQGFKLPTHGQTGRPVLMKGPFNPITPTEVTVGGKQAEVIVESARQMVFTMPREAVGPQEIAVIENGSKVASGNIRAIRINLAATKTALLKGETTELRVRVDGLFAGPPAAGDRLEVYLDPAYCIVKNLSPDVIEFFGPGSEPFVPILPLPDNWLALKITSDNLSKEGVFERTLQIRAKRAGAFRISSSFVTPSELATGPPPR